MAKKQTPNGDGGLGAFAGAMAPILNPKLQVHQIYASAFEDAISQINASLQPAGSIVTSIRARAAELSELADLIETTLAAKEREKVKDAEGMKEDMQEDCADKGEQEKPSSGKGE